MGVLIAMLLPALNKAREAAHAVACMSNLRQLGLAEIAYANDNKGYLPPAYDPSVVDSPTHGANWYWWRGPWNYRLLPYVGRKQPKSANTAEARHLIWDGVFHCPGKPNWNLTSSSNQSLVSYAQNGFSPGGPPYVCEKITDIRHPERMLLISDVGSGNGVTYSYAYNWSRSIVGGVAYPVFWHPGHTFNVLCVDGHVRAARVKEMTQYNSSVPVAERKLLLK